MSKYLSVSEEILFWLDSEAAKDEKGQRAETYDSVLRRIREKAKPRPKK